MIEIQKFIKKKMFFKAFEVMQPLTTTLHQRWFLIMLPCNFHQSSMSINCRLQSNVII